MDASILRGPFAVEVDRLGCLVGFEPTSSGATVRRSTAELQAPQGHSPKTVQIAIITTGPIQCQTARFQFQRKSKSTGAIFRPLCCS